MDIVSRLKTFISYLSVPVTQFADTCTIARPTLSQLLNGRNKKVSDELIGKIHEAYPELSVLWLMFGEGKMLHETAIDDHIQEPQSIFDFEGDSQTPGLQEKETPRIDFNSHASPQSDSELSPSCETTPNAYPSVTQFSASAVSDATDGSKGSAQTLRKIETLSYTADPAKKIVNIIVYYSDNSFESFVPNPHK